MRWVVAILAMLSCGCMAASVALYKIQGPAAVQPLYVPAKVPTLILVENYRHQSSVHAHAETLSQQLFAVLDHDQIAPLIPLDKVQTLRDTNPAAFRTMTVAQIAQAVGANQVIYVELKNADVTPLAGGVGFTGQASAVVKVIDDKGTTLWPIDSSQGHPIAAATKMGAATYPSPADVRQLLFSQLTMEVSHLFHKWTPEYEITAHDQYAR